MKRKPTFIYFGVILIILCFMYLHTRGQRELYMGYEELTWDGGYREGNYQVFDETNEIGTGCSTYEMHLNKGDYVIRIEYSEQFKPNIVKVNADGKVYEYELPLENTIYEVPISFQNDVRRASIEIDYQRTGKLTISSIELIGKNLLYTDTILYMFIFLLSAIIFYFYYTKFYRNQSAEYKLSILLIGCAIFISCLPLLGSSISRGHDIIAHLQRIEGIKESIQAGQFPTRIAPNENKGYGLLLTQYPFLFLYIPAVLRLLNVSQIAAYKILLILINIASAMTAYFSVKSIYRENAKTAAVSNQYQWAPTVSAIVFCLFPYRLVNIYTRSALGEALAMIFFPLLIAGLYHVLIGNKNKWYYLAIAATGIVNSHIISVVLALIVSVSLLVIWIRQLLDKTRIIALLKAGVVTLLLNCGYLVPFMYYYINKTTRVSKILSSNYMNDTLELRELFMKGNTHLALALSGPVLGFVTLVFILVLIISLGHHKKDDNTFSFMVSLFFLMLVFIVFSTSLMPYKQLSKIGIVDKVMSTIQFSFRFLSIAATLCALLMGYVVDLHEKAENTRKGFVLLLFLLLSANALTVENAYSGDFIKLHSFESIDPNMNYIDYIPLEADISDLRQEISPSTNAIEITDYVKNGSRVDFQYNCSEEGAFVDLPMFYYPGFAAKLENGTRLDVEKGENVRVRVYLPKTEAVQNVSVCYEDLLIFRIAGLISLATVLGITMVLGKRKKWVSSL